MPRHPPLMSSYADVVASLKITLQTACRRHNHVLPMVDAAAANAVTAQRRDCHALASYFCHY